jgi:ribosomal protein S18 acetylase RimI-like enzyme
MGQLEAVEFVDFTTEHADELVVMWRASFERAVGVVDPHSVEEQRHYLLNEVVPKNKVRVALANGHVVGFIAASAESIDQLYIHVDHQGRGIGSELLEWAKNHSSGRLWLYAFESNKGAQRFYESKGFHIAARGFEEDWQLNDIRYEWERP